jgi:hypothetical protein
VWNILLLRVEEVGEMDIMEQVQEAVLVAFVQRQDM